jgi:hypothetical protein
MLSATSVVVLSMLLAACLPDDDGGTAAPLPPADQLCELPDGVDGYWQVPCGQCGHRCLDGCTQQGRCQRDQVFESDKALSGPIEAGDALIVGDSIGAGDGEEIVRIDAAGEAQILATTTGQAFYKHVHDGWLYWVDNPLSGDETLQRTRVDGSGPVEDVLTNRRVSLLEVTDRGLYVQEGEQVSLYAHEGALEQDLFVEPDWFSIYNLDVFEHNGRLYILRAPGGLFEVSWNGGTPTKLADDDGYTLYADTKVGGVLYGAARGDEEFGTERERRIVAIDLEAGEVRTLVHWEQTSYATSFSAPLVHDDHLWWSADKTFHYFPLDPDEPMRLEAEDVDELSYRHAIHTEVDVPTGGGISIWNGYLYFTSFTTSRQRDPLTALYRVRLPN